eukprot:snap_masked-scaffold_58-processed-gene-0.41-mRNA-1 protein AED:1.00 eAED:1.00 QI:0/-1/0/0/-1/1/1/0/605
MDPKDGNELTNPPPQTPPSRSTRSDPEQSEPAPRDTNPNTSNPSTPKKVAEIVDKVTKRILSTPLHKATRSITTETLPFTTLDDFEKTRRETKKIEQQREALKKYEADFLHREALEAAKLDNWYQSLLKKEQELNEAERKLTSMKEKTSNVKKDIPKSDRDEYHSDAKNTNYEEADSISPSLHSKHSKSFKDEDDFSGVKSRATISNSTNDAATFLDKWSETGSSLVDKKKYLHKYEETPTIFLKPFRNPGQSYPLLQIQLPEQLKDLRGSSIEGFLHNYKNTLRNVPTLTIQSLLSKSVNDALYQRGVDLESSEAILRYLTRHLSKYTSIRKFQCIDELETKLRWPNKNMDPADQIYLFFDKVFTTLKYLNKEEMKKHEKKIPKIVLKKIPSIFSITYQELTLSTTHPTLSKLKSLLISRRFVLTNKPAKMETNIQNAKPSRRNFRRAELQYGSSSSISKSNTSGVNMPFTIRVSRVGKTARSIELNVFNIETKPYDLIKALADTGADFNVAGINCMNSFIIREEKPKWINSVSFLDKKRHDVKTVAVAKVMLTQGNYKLDLGEQKFFCVDSSAWDEIIIGDRTLKYHGITLNLQDAPKAVKYK